MYEKLSSENLMSAIEEASALVRQLAEPRPVGDTVKRAISRSWNHICVRLQGVDHSWSHNRVGAVWYRDRRIKVSGDELDQLRALQSHAKETRDDLKKLFDRVAQIENALLLSDAEFHRPDIDGLRQATRPARRAADRSGALDRAVAANNPPEGE